MSLIEVHFPIVSPYRIVAAEPQPATAELNVTPNPADVLAAVSYRLGTQYDKAESLTIYTTDGRVVTVIKLHKNSDNVLLDTAKLPTGTYIISLQADGKTILHQKLIKK